VWPLLERLSFLLDCLPPYEKFVQHSNCLCEQGVGRCIHVVHVRMPITLLGSLQLIRNSGHGRSGFWRWVGSRAFCSSWWPRTSSENRLRLLPRSKKYEPIAFRSSKVGFMMRGTTGKGQQKELPRFELVV
jgi:hypothetical protein